MDDQRPRNDPEVRAPASWKRFYVVLTGETNGAHKSIVKHFTSLGQTEVDSPEDSDYSLVFCPVVSRVGTDISYALDHLHSDKEVVLVVMHHTFNPRQVIPPSSRLVEDERVRLNLDCLFNKKKLLHSELNENMKTTIKKMFRVSDLKGFFQQAGSSRDPITETIIKRLEDLERKIKTLQDQNDDKDQKIKELEKKLQDTNNEVSELKKKMTLLEGRSKTGPAVSEEPGSGNHHTPASLQKMARSPSLEMRKSDGNVEHEDYL